MAEKLPCKKYESVQDDAVFICDECNTMETIGTAIESGSVVFTMLDNMLLI